MILKESNRTELIPYIPEYSYGKRKLDNVLLTGLDTIKKAHQDLIPKLWFNEKWSSEFLEFIKRLVDDNSAPEIVEIHPPFNDYCGSIGEFLDSYTGFEEALGEIFPDTRSHGTAAAHVPGWAHFSLRLRVSPLYAKQSGNGV